MDLLGLFIRNGNLTVSSDILKIVKLYFVFRHW